MIPIVIALACISLVGPVRASTTLADLAGSWSGYCVETIYVDIAKYSSECLPKGAKPLRSVYPCGQQPVRQQQPMRLQQPLCLQEPMRQQHPHAYLNRH